jgi:hypothetical protein
MAHHTYIGGPAGLVVAALGQYQTPEKGDPILFACFLAPIAVVLIVHLVEEICKCYRETPRGPNQ